MTPTMTPTITTTIRAAVNAELARRGMSVNALAHELDIPQPRLQHWLSGRGGTTIDRAEAVMAYLGLTVVPIPPAAPLPRPSC